jgi:hypothetical protein
MTTQKNSVQDLRKLIFDLETRRDVFSHISPDAPDNGKVTVRDAARNIFYGAILGATSVIDTENIVKKVYRKLPLKSISKTHLHNKLEEMDPQEVREFAHEIVKFLNSQNVFYVKLSNGNYTLGHFDGSRAMAHYVCVLGISGLVEMGIDIEPCDGAGQEPGVALIMQQRIKNIGLKIDIYTGDGGYYNFEFMQKTHSLGSDFFVTVRGDDDRELRIRDEIETAIEAREISKLHKEVVKYGVLYSGEARYRCWTTLTEYPDKFNFGVMIGKIEKLYLKGKRKGQIETHYFITSATELTPEDAITVMIEHWTIETLFNLQKNIFWNKHSYKKLLEAAICLMFLVYAALGITQWCKIHVFEMLEKSAYAQKRMTFKNVRTDLRDLVKSCIFYSIRLEYFQKNKNSQAHR